MAIPAEDILRQIDPRYLVDYLSFGGQVREYVNDVLSDRFRADPNDVRRRFHLVSLVLLEYAAYEDAAAMLKAILAWRAGRSETILATLLGYSPGEAVLDRVLTDAGIQEREELFSQLGGDRLLPLAWADWFPDIDLRKALLRACQFLVDDCRANHKKLGVAAYNKLKHGPIAVSRGTVLGPNQAPVPTLLIPNKWRADLGPMAFIAYGIPDDDESMETRARAVHFVQKSLRLIIAATLSDAHTPVLEAQWGSIERFWRAPICRDLREFADEITRKL